MDAQNPRAAVSKGANVLLLRQPICDPEYLRTRGHEVAIVDTTIAMGSGGNLAQGPPVTTLIDTLVDIGLDTIAGNNPVFITVHADKNLEDCISVIPGDNVVLQIDASAEPTEKVIETMVKLRSDGYRFALKNFRYRPSLDPILPLAHYVKLNIRSIGLEGVREERERLSKYDLRYLAVGADSSDDVKLVMKCGFDLIQGYFFCKPNSYRHKSPAGNRLTVVRLLAKLRDPAIGPKELETIIAEDVSLSYRLLRFINSAMNGLSRRVDSVRHAATLVGTERLRSWAMVVAFSKFDDTPRELLMVSLLRAKLAERVAEELGLPNRDAYFTAGLFSTIDAFLDCQMVDALESLPLSEEVSLALLSHSGRMGQILESIKQYEQGNWSALVNCLHSPDAVQRAYLHSLDWVRQSVREMGS